MFHRCIFCCAALSGSYAVVLYKCILKCSSPGESDVTSTKNIRQQKFWENGPTHGQDGCVIVAFFFSSSLRSTWCVACHSGIANNCFHRQHLNRLCGHTQLTVKVTYLGIRSAHERVWLVEENLFHCKFTMKARGLEFWGEGEGSGLSLTMLSMGT